MSETDENDPYAGHTPLMRQYLEMRSKHPGVLLLYRLGDFYETFFEDAVKVNRLLGLTLTHRGTFKGEPIPMAGVPASTLDQYLARLVRLGESVAISEQIGNPSEPRNGMMTRKIVRIVTAGTITDSALLNEKKDSVLLAITQGKLKTSPLGLVWLTLTNGNFRATKADSGELINTIARIAPSEILVTEKLKEKLLALGYDGTITELPDWHFDAQRGEEALKHRFHLDHVEAWGLEHQTELLASVNALLGYVEQTQCESLPHIEPLVVETDNEFIALDSASRRNLELTQTLRSDNGPTLLSTLDHCKTSMGSRLLSHWIHHPLRDQQKAGIRHDAVATLIEKIDGMRTLLETLASVPDIERTSGRLALKSIRPKEMAALRDAIPKINALKNLVRGYPSPLFEEALKNLEIDEALYKRLEETLLDEPATFLRDGDVIKSSVNAELAELRSLRDNAGEFLAKLEISEKERTGINNLRIEYNHVSGFYIEVPRGQADKVPLEYRRRQTLKNTERFTTPELKEYEEKALSAKERAAQLERTLWDQLVEDVSRYVPTLLVASKAVATIDVIASLAKHAYESDWVRPVFTRHPGLDIALARHPVIEHTLEHYVPNDCLMRDNRRLHIITGPNMGGKSTYMRSIALIALLTYIGSFVPAKSATVGPIDRILTRIGASDDLARGRSTFMVEMTEAASILHQATSNSLVLMDEIGRGTSTFDGLSLAAAIALELATKTKSWTLFATHYFELTDLAATTEGVINVHVCAEQTEKTIVFLHDVKEGPANQSYGIAVAQLAGVSPRVIHRAKKILDDLEKRSLQKGPQMDLFSNEPAKVPEPPERDETDKAREAFVRELSKLDADSLSPREALNLIYQIKDEAKNL